MAKGEETKKPKSKGALRRHKTLVAYSFILPNLIGFFVLTFIPIVFSILLSFCEWDSGNPIKFCRTQELRLYVHERPQFPNCFS